VVNLFLLPFKNRFTNKQLKSNNNTYFCRPLKKTGYNH